MHDIRLLRDQLEHLRDGMRRRGKLAELGPMLDRAESLERERRTAITELEAQQARRNKVAAEVGQRRKAGEDATALGFNAHGGVGCISVTANVAPKLCAEFQEATLRGDYAKALEYQDRLMPLHEAIFIEPGLAGAKYGLSLLGICAEEVRLPLLTLTEGTKAKIKAAMQFAGLI